MKEIGQAEYMNNAVLVGVQLPGVSNEEHEGSVQELGRLVKTLGYHVVGSLSQKLASPGKATVLGEGKLHELASWTGGTGRIGPRVVVKKSKAALRFGKTDEDEGQEDLNEFDEIDEEDVTSSSEPKAAIVVFDCELTPLQLKNLESATSAKVFDRTSVIIEIFSRHARTRAARLQVEIARLNYIAPRLRETGGGRSENQGGGMGNKGSGETTQELDRRRIRDRVKELKDEIEKIQSEHDVRRRRRSGENCVALVGYTNAGKSSLMRGLTGSEVLVADKLFATLDTTVRPMVPESVPRILLSDTVGFIKKLPHDLVASFRSTLDEALNADLLLFVVDASDPTFRSQLEVTRTVLNEIGATDIPSRLVLNKRDRVSDEEMARLHSEFPDAITISALEKGDLERMKNTLRDHFTRDLEEERLFVPYAVQGAIGEIRSGMRVLKEEFDEKGTTFTVQARSELLRSLKTRYGL